MRRFFADEWSNVRNQVFPGAAEMEKRYNARVEPSTVRSSLGRASGALYFITPKPITNITEALRVRLVLIGDSPEED
ncbi:uncharacterized protein LOC126376735 isoform X2 [Pectinophora gossypiella]|uniref:uncharacterized protein LOC126376735 isoform X2 n=1 Tax=Pectinophora gossypiella TaxID=13191 RepID=UPI00214F4F8C|nr:uncharacterized protein LOC126376735 isoform X2 [Pectinophora gossypiella]